MGSFGYRNQFFHGRSDPIKQRLLYLNIRTNNKNICTNNKNRIEYFTIFPNNKNT